VSSAAVDTTTQRLGQLLRALRGASSWDAHVEGAFALLDADSVSKAARDLGAWAEANAMHPGGKAAAAVAALADEAAKLPMHAFSEDVRTAMHKAIRIAALRGEVPPMAGEAYSVTYSPVSRTTSR
jgi:hypothetical protein